MSAGETAACLKRNWAIQLMLSCRVRVFQHRLEPDELTAKHLAMLGSATLVLVHSMRERYTCSNTVAGSCSYGQPRDCFANLPEREACLDTALIHTT